MKQIQLGQHSLLVVENVPIDAKNVSVIFVGTGYKLDWEIIKGKELSFDCIMLPSGQWELFGVAKDLSEEQWKGLVETKVVKSWGLGGFIDYESDGVLHGKALTSGHSFLRANNISMDSLILRKL